MVMGDLVREVDVAVVGGGPGGYSAAFRCAELGLDALVSQCRQIVQGVEPQALRDNGGLRQQVATQLSGVQSVLDGLLVDRPRRRIIRTAK